MAISAFQHTEYFQRTTLKTELHHYFFIALPQAFHPGLEIQDIDQMSQLEFQNI